MRDKESTTKSVADRWWIGGLFLLALGLRLSVLARAPWDGLYGQDAFAYWWQAEAIASFSPALDFFWPSGFPALVAPLILFLGETPLVALGVVVLAGALLPVLLYLLTREILPAGGPLPAGVAGGLAAVAGQPLLSSLTVMADIPALAWGLLGLWLALRGQRAARPITWWAAAGAALGMAVVTRWLMALLLPLLLLVTLAAVRSPQPRRWAALVVGALLPLLPQLWLTRYRPDSITHHLLLQWHPANSVRRLFETAEGVQQFALPPLLFNLYPALHPAYLLPPLGLLALAGVWWLWQRRAWPALVLTLGWFGAGYLLFVGLPYENFRYGLLLAPPIYLLSGAGALWLWQRLPRWRAWLRLALLLLMLAMGAWGLRTASGFIAQQNATKAWVAEAATQLPPDAALLAFGMAQIAREYTPFEVHNLFFEDAESLARRRAAERPLYLLVDVAGLEGQWVGLAPELAYRTLEAAGALHPLDQIGPLTLFEVR